MLESTSVAPIYRFLPGDGIVFINPITCDWELIALRNRFILDEVEHSSIIEMSTSLRSDGVGDPNPYNASVRNTKRSLRIVKRGRLSRTAGSS